VTQVYADATQSLISFHVCTRRGKKGFHADPILAEVAVTGQSELEAPLCCRPAFLVGWTVHTGYIDGLPPESDETVFRISRRR
jgi:hypothetical protein